MRGRHDEEEEDFFVGVVGSPAADAQAVGDAGVVRGGLDDGVDLAAAEADS